MGRGWSVRAVCFYFFFFRIVSPVYMPFRSFLWTIVRLWRETHIFLEITRMMNRPTFPGGFTAAKSSYLCEKISYIIFHDYEISHDSTVHRRRGDTLFLQSVRSTHSHRRLFHGDPCPFAVTLRGLPTN